MMRILTAEMTTQTRLLAKNVHSTAALNVTQQVLKSARLVISHG